MRSLLLFLSGILPFMHQDDPPPSETGAGMDAFRGKPTKVSPAQGIQDMTARIDYLVAEKARVQAGINNRTLDEAAALEEISRLDRELIEACQLLGDYKLQRDAQN